MNLRNWSLGSFFIVLGVDFRIAHAQVLSSAAFPTDVCSESILMNQARRWTEFETISKSTSTDPIVAQASNSEVFKGTQPKGNRAAVPRPETAAPDAFFLHSAPKVGGTSLRSFQGSTHSLPPHTSRTAAVASFGNRTATGFLVREPVSRFLSGVEEIIRHHWSSWAQWRGGFYKGTKGDLPLSVLHQDENSRALELSIAGGATLHGLPLEPALESAAAFSLLAGAMLTDLDRGFRNPHVNPQVEAALAVRWAIPRFDALIYLEAMPGSWDSFFARVGFPSAPSRHLGHARVGNGSNFTRLARGELVANNDAAALFCDIFSVDYACFSPPPNWAGPFKWGAPSCSTPSGTKTASYE